MNWGSPEFVIAIIAISTVGWIVNNWIRAKHGYELEDEWGGKTKPKDSGETQRLKAENAALHEKVDSMQDRMVNLERIVTDKGYSLSDEIEALRDRPSPAPTSTDGGTPLNLRQKETR